LQNDVAKNNLWRSAAVNVRENSCSATTQNKGKTRVPMPSFRRPHGSIGLSNHGSHNNFGGNGSQGASSSKLTWGHLKDAHSDFKSPSKSYVSDIKLKHEKATSGSKSYDSWNKAKAKLTDDKFNKRRRTNACINCGEFGHISSLIVPIQNPNYLRVV
jgi:hypothetical protein